jgi:hypothetical protein
MSSLSRQSRTSPTKTRQSLSSTQTPNAVLLYPHYPRPLRAIEEMVARVFSSQGISGEREWLCAHYSLDSVNSLAFVEAIPSPDPSTLSRIYLSACDFPDTESSTFCNTTHTPTDLLTFASNHLAPYTDLFLSTKKKYKPVTNQLLENYPGSSG